MGARNWSPGSLGFLTKMRCSCGIEAQFAFARPSRRRGASALIGRRACFTKLRPQRSDLTPEFVDQTGVVLEIAHLPLELENPADPRDVEPGGDQSRDLAQVVDVSRAVSPSTTRAASRLEQPFPLIPAERLGVKAGQLSSHGDREEPGIRLA